LIHLAKEGPKTRNEVAQELGSAYKNILFSFNSLKKKGLIKEIAEKKHRRRIFPKYWLTEEGVVLAFIEGASKDKLFETAKKFYLDDENLLYFIRFASLLNPQVFKIGYDAVKRKGKLEPLDLTTIMLAQAESEVSMEKFKEGLMLLKEYPKLCESFKQIIKNWDKAMRLVSEVLES